MKYHELKPKERKAIVEALVARYGEDVDFNKLIKVIHKLLDGGIPQYIKDAARVHREAQL